MKRIEFTVFGKPATKGSWKAILVGAAPRLIPDNKRSKPWERNVAMVAKIAVDEVSSDAIAVRARCYFKRPKAHFLKSGRRPNAPIWHVIRPDGDKLMRAILDALTGVVYDDDSQVCSMSCDKVYCDSEKEERAEIEVIYLSRSNYA